MSAGGFGLPSGLQEYRGVDCLAPLFRAAVEKGLDECRSIGLDPIVWESCRSQALQEFYYTRGRPPTAEYPRPVTWQRDAMKAWHFYGLAVDVISQEHHWFAVTEALAHGLTGEALQALTDARARQANIWFGAVAEIFKKHGCSWGGDWIKQDKPHFQWGRCRPSPSQLSIDGFTRGGKREVWRLVRAA
jgi:peptidoglycan L-alanyl-D-glutamate endopeptidase CwlK